MQKRHRMDEMHLADLIYKQYMKRVPRDVDPISLSSIPRERIFCHRQPSGHISQLDCASLLVLCQKEEAPVNPLTREPFSADDLLRLHVQCRSLGLIKTVAFPSLRKSYGKNASALDSFIQTCRKLVASQVRHLTVFSCIILHVMFALDTNLGIYFIFFIASYFTGEDLKGFWVDGMAVREHYAETRLLRDFVLTERDPLWFSSMLDGVVVYLEGV